MKSIIIKSLIIASIFFLFGCGSKVERPYYPGQALSLRAVGQIFRHSPNLMEFERKLNMPGNYINNLDLDQNGMVDYIKVVPFGDPSMASLSLVAMLGPNEAQEVANIHVSKSLSGRSKLAIYGVPPVYPPHYYYRTSLGMNQLVIYGSLFGAGVVAYRSPYIFGRPVAGYTPYRRMDQGEYRTKVERKITKTVYQKSESSPLADKAKKKSPYHGKVSKKFNTKAKKYTPSKKVTSSKPKSTNSNWGNKKTSTKKKSSKAKKSGWGQKKKSSKKSSSKKR